MPIGLVAAAARGLQMLRFRNSLLSYDEAEDVQQEKRRSGSIAFVCDFDPKMLKVSLFQCASGASNVIAVVKPSVESAPSTAAATATNSTLHRSNDAGNVATTTLLTLPHRCRRHSCRCSAAFCIELVRAVNKHSRAQPHTHIGPADFHVHSVAPSFFRLSYLSARLARCPFLFLAHASVAVWRVELNEVYAQNINTYLDIYMQNIAK